MIDYTQVIGEVRARNVEALVDLFNQHKGTLELIRAINSYDNDLMTPLAWAIHGFNKDYSDVYMSIIVLLLENGADPNSLNEFDVSPLGQAIEGGHFELVKLLLEFGAQPHGTSAIYAEDDTNYIRPEYPTYWDLAYSFGYDEIGKYIQDYATIPQ